MQNNPNIDEKKLNMMKLRILKLEKDNQKTRAKTSDVMVEKIRAIIKDEIKKTY